MPAVIFSSDKVKTLKEELELGTSGQTIQAGGVNPSSSAVTANTGSLYMSDNGSAGNLYVKQDNGSSTNWTSVSGAGSGHIPGSYDALNAVIQTTVSASALTISLLTDSGGTPSGADPVEISFRQTATSPTATWIRKSVTAATTIVVPSGATLGHKDATAEPIYVYAVNEAGGVKLAVSTVNTWSTSGGFATAIGAGSDSRGGFYSTSGGSGNVRLIGKIISTQTTAGTWASAPSNIENGISGIKEGATAWKYVKSADQTGITSGSYQQVTWNTEVHDTHEDFSSNSYTVAEGGYYYIKASIYSDNNTTGQRIIAIMKGATFLCEERRENYASTPNVLTASVTAYLEAGDTVDIDYFQASGSNQIITASGNKTFFEGFKIGDK